MKHETLNSIIAILGLGIAIFSTAYQLWPEADRLNVTVESRVDIGLPTSIIEKAVPNATNGELDPAIGPISWKIRVYNDSDRNVSITKYDFLGLSNTRLFQTNAFRERLSAFDPSLNDQVLPDNIGPRETKAYLFSFFLPFTSQHNLLETCRPNSDNFKAFERCFFLNGYDLFGNKVMASKNINFPDDNISVEWVGVEFKPAFLIDLQTGDGSRFSTTFSYFPF
jgi:hypothetical protein